MSWVTVSDVGWRPELRVGRLERRADAATRAKVVKACTRDRATVATVVRVDAEVVGGGTDVAVQAASVAATRTATRTRDRIVVISFAVLVRPSRIHIEQPASGLLVAGIEQPDEFRLDQLAHLRHRYLHLEADRVVRINLAYRPAVQLVQAPDSSPWWNA